MDMPNIQPIKLLKGTHTETGITGQGCFMNVIAYLNGEDVITDESPCVCPVIRRIAIWVNDYCDDSERARLLPYVMRAMGTATDDREIMKHRLHEVVSFANDMAKFAKFAAAGYAKFAAESAKYAAKYAAESAAESAKCAKCAAKYAESAAKSAAESAAKYAKFAAEYAAESAAKYAKFAAESAAEYAAESAAGYAAESAAKYAKSAAESAESAGYRKELIDRAILFLDRVCPPLQEFDGEVIARANRLIELAGV